MPSSFSPSPPKSPLDPAVRSALPSSSASEIAQDPPPTAWASLVFDARCVWAVAQKDWRLERRSYTISFATLFFAIIVLLVLAFAIGPETQYLQAAAQGVLWVALAFAGVTSANQTYQNELEDGAFTQLLLYPITTATIFLGKLLANWSYMMVLAGVLVPVRAALFAVPLWDTPAQLGWAWLTIALGTLGFAIIGTFYAALTANLRAKASLLPVLMFPVVVPVLLATVRASNELSRFRNVATAADWLQLLLGFDLIYIVLCTALYHVVVEDA